jgi:hypothetical protein
MPQNLAVDPDQRCGGRHKAKKAATAAVPEVGPPVFAGASPSQRAAPVNIVPQVREACTGCRAVRTARSWRAILPVTHLAREERMTVTTGRPELLVALGGGAAAGPLRCARAAA